MVIFTKWKQLKGQKCILKAVPNFIFMLFFTVEPGKFIFFVNYNVHYKKGY